MAKDNAVDVGAVDVSAADAKRRRRRRRRRKVIVAGLVAVLLVAGAGTAWALRGPDGPQYRLASVERTNVKQTVTTDGTLAARKTATASFASAGTVNSVRVAVGDKVSAGQVLATIDGSALEDAVTSAKTTLAQAKQKLADDEEAQANGTSSASTSTTTGSTTSASTTSNWSAGASDATSTQSAQAVLLAAVKPTNGGSGTPAKSSLTAAQAAVVTAQRKLDAAVAQQDTYVKTLITACAAGNAASPTTTRVTVGADGEVSGNAGTNPVIVALLDSGGNAVQTVRLANGGDYSFTGLTAGDTYRVQLTLSAVVDTDDCTAAVQDAQAGQKAVDSALTALKDSLTALTAAIRAQSTSGTSGSGSGGSGAATGRGNATGSAGTGSSSGSGTRTGATSGRTSTGTGSGTASTNGSGSPTNSSKNSTSTSGTTITAQQIAADAKAIDAAKVEVEVAEQNLLTARLRSPITGTVGAVAISKGSAVSASSSSSTITVVGTGTLSIALSISLADIDLVKAGQTAEVTVDGRSTPLPATVSYVGVLNSASSTGTSSTYSVTVQLDRAYASLYDGMGADVAIDVGQASGVLSVPVSAVHTVGTLHTVEVYANGKTAAKVVSVGVVGDELVQIKSGLAAGDRVVLAQIGAAIPSSTTFNRRGTRSGLTGLTGGTGGGGPPAGGGPGGR